MHRIVIDIDVPTLKEIRETNQPFVTRMRLCVKPGVERTPDFKEAKLFSDMVNTAISHAVDRYLDEHDLGWDDSEWRS